jgi:uncharacterized protein YcfJ
MNKKTMIGVSAVAVLAIAGIAYYAAYAQYSNQEPQSLQPAYTEQTHHKTVVNNNAAALPWKNQTATQRAAQPQPIQQQAQPCNDHNVVGTVLGGVAGGLIGHGLGKGSGKTAATVAGAAGGAYLGNQYAPTNGVACR